MAGQISTKVDLSELKLDVKSKKMRKALQRGVSKGAFLLEGAMKRIAPVIKGRYRSSIAAEIGKLEANIGPHVVYGGWVEDGADSAHAPKTHKSSGFKGHKVVQKTAKSKERAVLNLINKEIGKAIR